MPDCPFRRCLFSFSLNFSLPSLFTRVNYQHYSYTYKTRHTNFALFVHAPAAPFHFEFLLRYVSSQPPLVLLLRAATVPPAIDYATILYIHSLRLSLLSSLWVHFC